MKNTKYATIRRWALCILFPLMLLAATIALTGCIGGYKPKSDIDAINTNAVLEIERDKISFAYGMDVDLYDVVVNCGCVLADDEGHEVKVTRQHLTDGKVVFTSFDLETTGVNRRVTVSYKDVYNYVFYDVTDYKVELYTDADTVWKSEKAAASLNDNNELSVNVNLNERNYSTDSVARQEDAYHAERFNGWYTEDGASATGNYALAVKSVAESTLKLYAEYLTDAQFDALELSYDNRYGRVFSGYKGAACDTVAVPEGVTYVDLYDIFSSSPSVTSIDFKALDIPSTARLDLPFTSAINTRGLEAVSVDRGNPYYASFDGALYSKDYTKLYFMPASCSPDDFREEVEMFDTYSCAYWQTKKFALPDTVRTLNDYCFAHSSLIEIIGLDHVETVKRGVLWDSGVAINENGGSYMETADGKFILTRVDTSLTDFTVKEGTVEIAQQAFAKCTKLKNVNLGNELKVIGEYAFLECTALEEITLPATVTDIGMYAFNQCNSLVTVKGMENITFSSEEEKEYEVTSCLFYQCPALKNVTLPDKTDAIGSYAFSSCTALESIDLKNVTAIANRAFYQSGLTAVELPASLTSLGTYVFSICRQLVTADLSKCTSEKITKLSDNTFRGCSVLETVVLPDNITKMGTYCFYQCAALSSVSLDNITEIGQRCFYECSKLTQVNIENVKSFPDYAFYKAGLTSVEFGDGVTTIGKNSFRYTNVETVTIPDSVTEVNGFAFANCLQLKSITIGAGVKTFGVFGYGKDGKTFDTVEPVSIYSTNLEEIVVSADNKYFEVVNGALYGSSVCDVDYGARGVLYAMPAAVKEMTSFTDDPATKIVLPYSFQGQRSLTEVTFSAGVVNIGKVVFNASESLERLNIATTVEFLGVNLLLDCQKEVTVTLTEVEGQTNDKVYFYQGVLYSETTALLANNASGEVHLKDGTTNIAAGTFMNNEKITKVVLPDSLTHIEKQAFENCFGIEELVIGTGLETFDDMPFRRLSSLKTITVKEGNTAFKAVDNVLYDYSGKKLILCAAQNGFTDLTELLSTVETIGEYAFSDHATLKEAKLPEGVKVIANYSFYECRKLEVFYASMELEEIGEQAFCFKTTIDAGLEIENRRCNALKTVLLYSGLKKLGASAFAGQYGIEQVFYDMSESEVDAFWADKNIATTNSIFLTHGCPNPQGGYYNEIKSYLFSRGNSELTVAGYGWFRYVDGEPVPWENEEA